jgi:gametolysin peptidase M11/alpha-galactosidase-like protein
MLRPSIVTLCVLASTFPARVFAQDRAPAAVPAQAAASFEGEFEVQYEDGFTGAQLRHYLRTTTGRRLELRFSGAAPELPHGSRVRAIGTLQNNTLMLGSGSSGLTTLSLASPNTFGVQNALVILMNFSDNAAQPYTAALAQDVTFNQTSSFYLENSYAQTSLQGSVAGWFTIAGKSTTCDTDTWAAQADQAAKNAGVNVSNYPRRIYGFPYTSACAWWGLGTIGGGTSTTPSRAWVNGTYSIRVVAHELGHNFGDYHSRSSSCDTTGCTIAEYGDDRDIMGATTAHFNAFQKERLGWLNYGGSPPIQTVTQSGNYALDAMELPGSGPKGLKVLISDGGSGRKTWYYVEVRTNAGFDGSIVPGVIIHTGAEASGDTSYEIDLSPQTSTFDSLLDVGQTFLDPALGLSITTLSADAAGATVSVSFGPSVCTNTAPLVSMSPIQSQPAKAGTAVSYTVTVSNADGTACAPSTFNLSSVVPAGWTVAFSSPSLTLAPGASASTTIQVTSPATATDGAYPVSAAATNASDSSKSASVSVSYVVLSSLSIRVVADQGSYARNQTVKLSATVMAGATAAPGVSVSFKIIKPNGTTTNVIVPTDYYGVATYSLRLQKKDPVGVYQVTATGAMNGLSGSGNTSFTVK